jgi:hypothetical protein
MATRKRTTRKQRGSGPNNNKKAAPAKKQDTLYLDEVLDHLTKLKAEHGNIPVYFLDSSEHIEPVRKRHMYHSDEGGWDKVLIEM